MSIGDTVTRIGLRALMRLPAPLLHRLAGDFPRAVAGRELDARARLLFAMLERQPQPDLATMTPERSREMSNSVNHIFGFTGPEMRRIDDLEVPGGGGTIPARLYVPRWATDLGPLLVYFQGGGFVDGELDTAEPFCLKLAARSRVRVLSVEYRKAPEHPFPAAVEDALASTRWALERARALGADPARVAVGGDSAGANLAAVVCQQLRDAGGPTPALQVLIYPVVDATIRPPSFRLFGERYGLTSERYEWFLDQYAAPEQRGDPRVSPLLADTLAGLPPAIVLTAGFDVLHDEGATYARRLRRSGVPVDERCAESLFHGFAKFWELLPAARAEMESLADALRARLSGPARNERDLKTT